MKGLAKHLKTFLAIILLAVILTACGYTMGSEATLALPPDVRTLTLDGIENPTFDTELPASLASRLRDEITNRHQLSWASAKDAQGKIKIKINRYYLSTETAGAEDQTLKTNVNVTLEARIIRRLDGAQVWESGPVSISESFTGNDEQFARSLALELAVRRIVDKMSEAY